MGSTLPSAGSSSVFTILRSEGRARVGQLSTKNGLIATPASLVHTRRGFPTQMSMDIVAKLHACGEGPHAFQLDVMQHLTQPTAALLLEHGGGVAGYYNIKGYPVVASNRDPTNYAYGVKPSQDNGVHVMAHSGGIKVTPQMYMSAVQALRPDIYVTMCDEVAVNGNTQKRLTASVKRNVQWVDKCLEQAQELKLEADCIAFAAIGGAGDVQERSKSADAVAGKEVSGFALCGFGTGEDPAVRAELIQAAVDKLPEAKPRFMSGVSNPLEVLDAVSHGVDVFDNSYVTALTLGGYAACFRHAFPSNDVASNIAASDAEDVMKGADAGKLNLWSLQYRLDKGPLVPGCNCFACKNHSRGYIHHLLQAREMLGDVLLEIHNTQWYLSFMASVRSAIKSGSFIEYQMWFQRQMDAIEGAEDAEKSPRSKRIKLG